VQHSGSGGPTFDEGGAAVADAGIAVDDFSVTPGAACSLVGNL